MHPKAILLLKPFVCQRAQRSRPKLSWVATDTCTQLGSQRKHKHSTYRLSVTIAARDRVSRGLTNGKDGTSGKTRKRKSDKRQLEEYRQNVGKKQGRTETSG